MCITENCEKLQKKRKRVTVCSRQNEGQKAAGALKGFYSAEREAPRGTELNGMEDNR